ncbi:MAG: cytochrome c-type biogenesis protein CcmH [Ancalomicrobiaceae bacterium]|nr:cytochrome c-type biogenesis protein CcmH [Ancalomicrobiaceae bacterium]
MHPPFRSRFAAAVLAFLLTAAAALSPAYAVKPDEVLKDPVLEARARALSSELRCLVCQNQSIDDSDADLARDLRLLVRDRLKAGDTDAAVKDYLVARYGEYVLLRPRFSFGNLALWLAGPITLLAGAVAIFVARRRASNRAERPLTDDEEARLEVILAAREASLGRGEVPGSVAPENLTKL